MSIGSVFLDLSLNTKAFNSQLANVSNNAQKQVNKSFGGMGKFIAGALTVGAITAFSKSCLDLGSDLAEVQNVVDVVFPNMNSQVNGFAKNAIGSFGLSETVAKRMTGTFGAMSKAFGFSEGQAYDMATALTGLAGDVSSFYNISADEAYTKLKSVFSGETETLKDLGVVMTQSALDQYALANGYGKTTAKMSEQEKVALRLAFVTEQFSAASGDFARNSDSWANKTRVLSLNFQSLKASIGQGLINVLSPVVTLINNIIVGLNKAVQYFVAFTSLLSGKKVNSSMGSVSKSIDNASSGASNLTNGISDAGKAAKKTAKELGSLAGFDEITNLNTSSSGSSGAGGTSGTGDLGGGMDIASGTNDALNIDTSGMEKSIEKMKSMWNGFTTFLGRNKEVIISILAGIAAGFATLGILKNLGAITSGFTTLATILKAGVGTWNTFFGTLKMGGGILNALTGAFGTTLGPIIAIVAAVAAVTAALVYLYQTSESFRNLVNDAVSNLFSLLNQLWTSILQPLFSFLADVFMTILVPIATFLMNVFVGAVNLVASVFLILWNNVLVPIASFLIDVFASVLETVIRIWDKWKPGIETLIGALDLLWKKVLQPISEVIIAVFAAAFEVAGPIITGVLDTILAVAKIILEFFVGLFTLDMDTAWKNICKIFDDAISAICDFFRPVTDFFADQWGMVMESFNNVGKFISGAFNSAWTGAINLLKVPFDIFVSYIQNIWNTIKGVFNGIIKFVTGVFTGNWKKAWQGVKDVFSSIVSGIANIFKTPINWIIGGINTFIGGLNKIKIPDWVPLVGGKGFNIGKIPKLAEGGYVKANTPQLAMIGDNRHQGEIVSPEGKMYDIMMSALQSFSGKSNGIEDAEVIVSILYEILEAIRALRLIVDADSLNKSNKEKDDERSLRTGRLVLE